MRGEDETIRSSPLVYEGSPPLARGRRSRSLRTTEACRLTPACAGKTRPVLRCSDRSAAHPRLRGEDFLSGSAWKLIYGSPPLARGRQRGPRDCCDRPGLTPACAGKTDTNSEGGKQNGAHPRLRGEDNAPRRLLQGPRGSPPLARGRLRADGTVMPYFRLTPACAGKTSPRILCSAKM